MLLEKTLESPLECKEISLKGNQSWIFTGRTDAEAEAPVLGPLMQRSDSLEKTLMLGKTEGRRRRGWQRITWLDSNTDSIDMNLSKLWEYWWTRKPSMLQSMGLQKVRHDWVTELTQPALYWWTVCPSWRLFRNKRDASFYKMFMVKFGKCYTFLLEMHNAYKHNKFSEKSCNIEISSFF